MNSFWLLLGGSPFVGWWWVVVDVLWLVVDRFWLMVGGGGLWWMVVNIFWLVVGGGGWWHSLYI